LPETAVHLIRIRGGDEDIMGMSSDAFERRRHEATLWLIPPADAEQPVCTSEHCALWPRQTPQSNSLKLPSFCV
jgi:hypothetical protein